MKKICLFFMSLFLVALSSEAQSQLNCDFTVNSKACLNQAATVIYTGGVSANATYLWNFDGAVIISGTGQGPYAVRWETIGEKHVTLSINFEGLTCTAARVVAVIEHPSLFHMTGGGEYIPGTQGVEVGLSGSQAGIIYKLRLNGQYTGVVVHGTGQGISFGPQTIPGNYTAVARVDGSECMTEMEGVAVVTSNPPPQQQFICMVTFDTLAGKNKLVWNKHPGLHLSHYNIYKENYQNNVFTKIGEVPYSNLSVYLDPSSDPRIKSDRYKISLSDSAGHEGEKSPYHKTIHLNINPGIVGFNLIWNHYEGFDFKTYRIHRKHGTGGWQVIDSIAGNVDSYTDLYSASGVSTYFIEVVRQEPCSPSLKSDESLRVISNTASAAPLGMGESGFTSVLLYPNPVGDMLNLVLPGQSVADAELLRLDGVSVFKGPIRGPKAVINVADLPGGLYILRITGENTNVVRKFIKD